MTHFERIIDILEEADIDYSATGSGSTIFAGDDFNVIFEFRPNGALANLYTDVVSNSFYDDEEDFDE